MKRFITLFSASVLLYSFHLLSDLDEVVNALKTGNTAQIVKYFDATIDITVPGNSNNYSKSQAELVLKDFFATNPVKNFEVKHKGENSGSQYCIGNLVTKNGVFRTTIYMKQRGDRQLLQEIRFEVG
jgi:hypothetical protein